ncbi:raftlin-like isoform X3 [Lates japonicus]|uniref:Raftlin-like isoform X3 n=1 Tax=Lates japonicus TaxID=270547 RepID=A0AAD3RLS3_LATJO|nr:raftlin-like isoform X3 [Lates japonicus]
MFVGFVQEPYGAPCTTIREPDTPSLSLHSSPSSVLGSLGSCSPSNPSSPKNHAEPGAEAEASREAEEGALSGEKAQSENTGKHPGSGVEGGQMDEVSPATSPISELDLEHSEELTEEKSPCHNNNKDSGTETKERPRYRLRRGDEMSYDISPRNSGILCSTPSSFAADGNVNLEMGVVLRRECGRKEEEGLSVVGLTAAAVMVGLR